MRLPWCLVCGLLIQTAHFAILYKRTRLARPHAACHSEGFAPGAALAAPWRN